MSWRHIVEFEDLKHEINATIASYMNWNSQHIMFIGKDTYDIRDLIPVWEKLGLEWIVTKKPNGQFALHFSNNKKELYDSCKTIKTMDETLAWLTFLFILEEDMTQEQKDTIYEDAFSIATERSQMDDEEAHAYAEERVKEEIERRIKNKERMDG